MASRRFIAPGGARPSLRVPAGVPGAMGEGPGRPLTPVSAWSSAMSSLWPSWASRPVTGRSAGNLTLMDCATVWEVKKELPIDGTNCQCLTRCSLLAAS